MTASGTTNQLLTAEQTVQAAAEELGYVAAGETVTGEDLKLGLRQLSAMLKSLTARGVDSWLEETRQVTFTAGQQSVLLDQSIDEVTDIRVADIGQRSVFRFERAAYKMMPNKAQQGIPTAYYAERERDQIRLFLWPVPRTTMTFDLDILRVIQDVTTGDQTLDVPQKWAEGIYLALAARLAGPFGITRTDPATANAIASRAAAFEQMLLDYDRPASVYIGSYGGRAW